MKSKYFLDGSQMKKITINGILTSLALVLSFSEHFIPLSIIVPLPGVKLGLANIVTMFALFYVGAPSAFLVTILRCLLASLLFGGMPSLLYSLSGALLSLFIMLLLKPGYNKAFTLIGISMAGAAAHNFGQIIMASLMLKSTSVFAYLPFLLFTGLVTGLLTAIVSVNLFSIFEKTNIIKSFK